MSFGITFGAAKGILATVVENGSSPLDPRVKTRTDEAQQMILNVMIPVNGMQTVDVMATGTTLLLPKEMESAYEVQVLGGATVYNSTDITQGWSMVNQFTYLDPSSAFDNPLVDQHLQPDPVDNTILRRQYDYPGLQPGASVRVTGPKRWLPIESDSTFLIVQNVPALKLMIQAIEAAENNDHAGAGVFKQSCFEILQGEVKKHQLDPINFMRRKSEYEKDLINFPENSFGWMRANLGIEVPGAISRGKQEWTFILGQAEKRLMQKGMWKDTVQEYTATVTGGQIALPLNVQSVIAIDLNGHPIPVRSQFLNYLENGPGAFASHPMLVDNGETNFFEGRRRVYTLLATTTQDQSISLLCKLRWVPKVPTDEMVIKSYEALRLMSAAIMLEEKEDWQNAMANQQMAVDVLHKELDDYLKGIVHTVRVQSHGFGLQSVGHVL